MDIIKLLPDSVANQIAAGEVIQRPASVIKELVENAVDAGAHSIEVFVTDSGRTSIQVIDDGKGMSETDARLAFERHATSKIRCAEDLFTLRTMGFRGEALPSIVAVAQVVLQTRTPEAELGTRIEIEGSRLVSQDVCSCPAGANFEVKNLFFNIPARRKFLKSNQTELNHIITEFQRIALVNTSVAFTLISDGNVLLKLPESNLRQRIVGVFGKKLGEQLISVDVDTTLLKISGFVGRPESAHKKNVHQYFFVNGRYMRHPYFNKAVTEAFEGLVANGEQVPYFLYFDVDPANIDVNISPTKTEIKFENEKDLWRIILTGIREALGRSQATPTIEFDTYGSPELPVFDNKPKNVSAPQVKVDTGFTPFAKKTAQGWNELYESLVQKTPSQQEYYTPEIFEEQNPEPEISNQHFQYKGQYILTAAHSGLMIIDQHRAHVRVLYDKYRAMMKGEKAVSQGLLFPEILQLSVSDGLLLESLTDQLLALGFDVVSLGGGNYSILGVPAGIDGLSPQKLLTDIIASIQEGTSNVADEIQHNMALTLARSAAIVHGQILSDEEMRTIVASLFASQNPNYAPDGSLIISIFQQENIDKMFS